MLNRNKTTRLLSGAVVCVLSCLPTFAQQSEQPRRTTEETRSSSRLEQPPDFARENLNRVAASVVQIKEVLLKDPGLFVELKRLVAKEATDNGQLVTDDDLSDDAIFERLSRDLEFRSLATRLAQRYGYLLPNINPESEAGKQQDLILKERARRLVQIEGQEDAAAIAPGRTRDQNEENLERTSCDTRRDPRCEEGLSSGPHRRRALQQEPDENEQDLPELPQGQAPGASLQQLLRANASRRAGLDGSATDESGAESDLMMASSSISRAQGGIAGMSSVASLGGAEGLAGLANMGGAGGLESLSPLLDRDISDSGTMAGRNKRRTVRLAGRRGLPMEKELAPVSMVHKANPYADIPSLYDMYVQASAKGKKLDRFGLEVFRNGIEDLDSIPMDVPASPDYVVGPGDGLSINMWGSVSTRFSRTVDREGRISLPQAGPLLVSGHTLGEVQQAAQQLLRTQYREVSVDVSLSRLRTVRVYVVGDVAEPGAYDISALSTVLNALFEAGGVTPGGSLRTLRHYQGKQLVEEVDAYDLLLHGVRGDLHRLENGDTLMVPPIGPQVTVEGMVRRPAIYELHGETTLEDVLELAGGILPAAALQHIEVQRLEAHEKRTMLNVDVPQNTDSQDIVKQLSAFKIQDGDQFHVFPIAPYNESSIYLQGHVLRPGRYSYHDGMKLNDVIASYSDLLPEPAGRYAEIVRLNPPDFHPTVESFDLSSAMANPATGPKLQPLDTIRIFSRFDFEQPPSVWVGGEVRKPGNYQTSGQAHLRDAIFLAGGVLPDASLGSAQLVRTESDGTLKIMSLNLGDALSGNPVDNLVLQPRDRVLIHRNSAQVDPPSVYIKGEVAKPGRYPLTGNMRVEDLVRLSGGLKRGADAEVADLTSHDETDPLHPVTKSVDVQLSAAMGGDAKADIPLRDRDVLTIRQSPGWNDAGAMVTVKGEVEHPGTYGIHPGERLSSVLLRAGGFGPQAYPYGAVLMRREVRELEIKSHAELVQRVRAEEVSLKALPDGDTDQRNMKLTAISQSETALRQLEEAAPIGRVVVHIKPELKEWRNTVADVPVRDGDMLVIPKRADYIVVSGQVFNATAVSYKPGRSARWYLSQSGGLTPLADKNAVFVIRADGSVIAAKNNSEGWFAGNPLNAVLKPGDSVVVPERAPKIGGRNWQTLFQSAQVASSVALAVAYIHP